MASRIPVIERFWRRVQKADGCWIWAGQKHDHGYGQIDTKWATGGPKKTRKVYLAHRLSWEIHNGPIPDGMDVLHKCDNPPCVNPAHLFLGTQRDNNTDKIKKERQVRGEKFPHAKLTEAAVADIRKRYAAGGVTQQSLADEHGVARSQIYLVVHGKSWWHVPAAA